MHRSTRDGQQWNWKRGAIYDLVPRKETKKKRKINKEISSTSSTSAGHMVRFQTELDDNVRNIDMNYLFANAPLSLACDHVW